MNSRREPRFEVNQPVEVTILGNPDTRMAGRVADISGSGMRLLIDRPVALGSAVRVDLANSLLLGEVCYCRQEVALYAIGVRLEHLLTNIGDLARLMQALSEETLAPAAPSPGAGDG